MENIGLNIKTFRLRENWTQSQLAEKVGVSRTAISSWEIGRTEPSIGDIEKLSEVFGCLKTDLIGAGSIEYYLISSREEKELIEGYRNAAPDVKAFIHRMLVYNNVLKDINDEKGEKK